MSRSGYSCEKDCRDELIETGHEVFSPTKTSFFGVQDIFNMWDVVAINKEQVRFIQVKKTGTAGFLKKLREWSKHYNLFAVTWELWVRHNTTKEKKKWTKYYARDGFITKEDSI